MASCVYVLHCRENKYYIGRTNDLATRFVKHKVGNGSQWTKMYAPIAIVDVLQDAPFAELTATLHYMNKYGIENVRGGPWCTTDLLDSQKNFIRNLLEAENFARPSPEAPPEITNQEDIPMSDANQYQRHGCVWETEEIKQLFDCMNRGVPLSNISLLLRRKETAIRSYVTKQIRNRWNDGTPVQDLMKRFNLPLKDIEQACHNTMVDMDQYLA